MNLNFEQQLNRELLRSERKRTIILISIFLFAISYRTVDLYFFKQDEDMVLVRSFSTVWLFPLTVILFEVFYLLYINRCMKKKQKKIPLFLQYLNTGLEICLPSFIMLIVAKQYPSFDVFKSPAVNIYFLFIILSTLRLNFRLSFLCGLLAAASYTLISVFIYHHFTTSDSARAVIFLLSGTAAGLVAKQIREGVNSSLKEAEKRHRVESLFGQQLSAEVAEKILANDGKMESKRMKVAVMFIDIRNFTNFAAEKSPEEIVQYQNTFFSIVINIISKHEGIVHQFLGDGCMITFGAPVPLLNPSQNAVEAACDLLLQLETAGKAGDIIPTKIGIGIHTGEVVTGNIGTNTRQQYSVTGQTVIMASRIEQLNKGYQSQLLISEDVAKNIAHDKVKPEIVGPVSLKGYHKEVLIYKVA